MTEGVAVAGPNTDRIETLDFIRGCVLFGILLMNITAMGLAKAYTNPANAGGATGADLWAWIVTEVGFEGTQRAIFSMLFGAGVLLFTSRAEQAGRTDALDLFLRRTLLLIGFGLVNAWVLLWDGDILYHYGITGLFVVAFRKLSPKTLLGIGLAGLLFNVALNYRDAYALRGLYQQAAPALALRTAGKPVAAAQKETLASWDEAAEHFVAPPDAVAKANAAMRGGYISAWQHRSGEIAFMEGAFFYRYFFDVFAMMLIGMALLKGGVLTTSAPARLHWTMLIGGYGVGLLTNIAETRWIIDNGFAATAFAQTQITYDLGRLSMAAGHLGAMLLFCRSGLLGWWRQSMAAVGRMALTNYLTHSLVALVLFVGFGLYGRFARHELYYIVFAVWTAQLIVSPIWLRHFRFGPVEWLWRTLTYGKAPPFRRAPLAEAQLAPA